MATSRRVKTGQLRRVTFWAQKELIEKFRAKVPPKRRSSYLRMCLEILENDVKFMELQAALTEKQLLEWNYRIDKKKQETEIAYRKKEILT